MSAKGGPDFAFSLPGGGVTRPPATVSHATSCCWILTFIYHYAKWETECTKL